MSNIALNTLARCDLGRPGKLAEPCCSVGRGLARDG